MIASAVVFILFIVLYLFFTHKKDPKMPPGIYGWPIIGTLPSMKTSLVDQVEKYRKEYGDIFLWRTGMRNIVYLCDPKLIKKAFSSTILLDRPDPFYSFDSWSNYGKTGVINANGLQWLSHRRFTLRHLRDAGFGKSEMENIILMEAEYLIKDISENYLDIVTEVPDPINVAALNVIWKLEADIRFERTDEDLQKFLANMTKVTEQVQGLINLFDLFPFLSKIIPKYIARNFLFHELEHTRQLVKDYIRKVVEERKRNLNKENPCGLIDWYLLEIENEDSKGNFSESALNILLGDMFFAGKDTTAFTLKWGLQYMATYPKIQEKIQHEIDSVIPKDRLPSLLDRANLPYTEATIHELLRFTSIAPFGLYRAATEDTTLEQYSIPKGTIVAPFIHGCHMDPKYWEKPTEFYPDHFLDSGKLNIKNEAYIPFSVGKRSCLGESLAKSELFLLFGAMMQKFTFKLAEENKSEGEMNDPGSIIFNMPSKLKIIIHERHD